MAKKPLMLLSLATEDDTDDLADNKNDELIPEDDLNQMIISKEITSNFIINEMRQIRNNLSTFNKSRMQNLIKNNISRCRNPIIHRNRRFAQINEIYRYSPIHNSYTCMFENKIFKLINCEAHYVSDFTLIKEIAFQEYAHYLSSQENNEIKCNFHVPSIISYGRITINPDEYKDYFYSDIFKKENKYNCLWFIEMDRLKYSQLAESLKTIDLDDPNVCSALSDKLRTLESCLKNKNLFHNDYHEENVFYDKATNTIGLIDYGISENVEPPIIKNNTNYTCGVLKQIKARRSSLKSPTRKISSSSSSKRSSSSSSKRSSSPIRKRSSSPIRKRSSLLSTSSLSSKRSSLSSKRSSLSSRKKNSSPTRKRSMSSMRKRRWSSSSERSRSPMRKRLNVEK